MEAGARGGPKAVLEREANAFQALPLKKTKTAYKKAVTTGEWCASRWSAEKSSALQEKTTAKFSG